jgi:hypothetical protein
MTATATDLRQGARIRLEGSKHLYVAGVRRPGADRFEISVEANNRTQASSICRKIGLEVCDMYMEG